LYRCKSKYQELSNKQTVREEFVFGSSLNWLACGSLD